MKKLIIGTFLLVLAVISYSQPKPHFKYRPAPELGEKTAIAGVLLVTASKIGAFGFESKLSKATAIAGYGFCVVGVKISIDVDKHKFRRKHRRR